MEEFLTEFRGELIAAAATGLVGLVPQARTRVWRAAKGVVFLFRAPFILLVEVREIAATLADVLTRLKRVEHEVDDNSGGSMKDHTRRMENRHRAEFWQRGRPAMEIHANGAVVLVSEALCRLFGVRDPKHVLGRNWLRFADSAEVEAFTESLATVGDDMEYFRFEVELFSDFNKSCGRWEFNANLVNPPIQGKLLLSGHWTPSDAVAKAIATKNSWAH